MTLHPHPNCHDCEQFFKCEELPPCAQPPAAPATCPYNGMVCPYNMLPPPPVSPDTGELLAILKTRYRNEMAILDYIEMIECELMAIDENKRCTLP